MLYGQAKCRLDQASTRQDFRIGETCVLLCPGQVMGELEGLGARTESQTRTSEEKKKKAERVTCSVPHGPVAVGYVVRDLMEGGAHQIKGLVGKGGDIV